MKFFVLSILLFSLFVLSSCENDLEEVNKYFAELKPGTEVAKDVEILYSDSAKVRVVIKSPTLVRYLDKRRPRDEFPDGLHVDFLDDFGRIESTLDARYGERLPREKKIIVRDSVVLLSTDFQKLETSELIWNEDTGEVHTDKFVRITQGDEIITAYGFKANQDFKNWTLQTVRARVKVEEFNQKNQN